MAPVKKKQKMANGSASAIETNHTFSAEDKKDDKAEQQKRSLFIRSLPPTATTESLTEVFSESYPIKHATAVIDPATKQCRGYGFVTFADAEDAQRAKEEFNGYALKGRKLRVEAAEPRQRDADSGDKTANKQDLKFKKPEDGPQPSRLIVRNLPWTIKTTDQLSKLFLSYGKIKQAYIPKKGHGRMSGFGFVILRGRKNAEKALAGMNGKEVDGRTIAVDWAVNKTVYEDLLERGAEEGKDDQTNGDTVDDEAEGDDVAGPEDEEEFGGMALDEEDAPIEVDEDDEDGDEDDDVGDAGEIEASSQSEDKASTVFVRNLPFTCTDEDLEDHFTVFGKTRYARVVVDAVTERSKGTGFVCFYNKADADVCVRGAPKHVAPSVAESKESKSTVASKSILQNEATDPTGKYLLDGRVMQVSRAVEKTEANRLTQEGVAHRYKRNEDKRRLYLLSEGTISSKSQLWESLSITERNMRDASAKQRKTLIESNPSLHLSLTRLSVRNVPRSINSMELKALAREAVVGFASDVKGGTRRKLSKEEIARGGEDMQAAERARKKAGRGVVRQAKVVFEGASGSKVREDSGAGRSRGYGFIEYYTHRNALMGLRWLNGHAIGYQVKDESKPKVVSKEDRKKRLIVEFAIENAQVVMRRKDLEQKARDRSRAVTNGVVADEMDEGVETQEIQAGGKRKRGSDKTSTNSDFRKQRMLGGLKKASKDRANQTASKGANTGAKRGADAMKAGTTPTKAKENAKKPIDEKVAQRNRIIGRKRAMRRTRKG